MNVHPSIATHPNVSQWLEFTVDERIIVHTGKVDIGQRISTALAIIAAEELGVNYNRIDVKRTQTGLDPDEGFTAGSMSMQHSGNAVRLASATARRYLIDLAAEQFGQDSRTLVINDGKVQSRVTGAQVSYWSLLTDKTLSIRIDETAPTKQPSDYSWIGKAVIPKGLVDIVRGKTVFVHDLQLPQMLHSRVVRPPHYAARIAHLDITAIKNVEESGAITIRDGSFLAVAATDEYIATKAAA
ncbi:MAG: xanthine dehydrogenase family protein molybdopterin-binding subunit, partial [SAR202 cluster bacterium]